MTLTAEDRERIREFNATAHPHPHQLLPDDDTTPTRERTKVSAEECGSLRQQALDGALAHEIDTEANLAADTIRRHIRGDCRHDIEMPELVYRNGRWVQQWGQQ